MMSSATASLASSRASDRPERSFNSTKSSSRLEKPDLDTLVPHLVAAKRSLSSIHHVWRANEIVTTARAALEESVIVSARTRFLRRGLDEQIQLLHKVVAEVEDVAHRGHTEFAGAIEELDAVDDRLRQTLQQLRGTTLESAFCPETEASKTLYDFIDESAVDDLQSLLKNAIDNVNTAQSEFDASNSAFNADLHSFQHALSKYRLSTNNHPPRISSSSSSGHSLFPPHPLGSHVLMPSPSTIPALLRSLESHAQEMAGLLESLVHHFDLCVTAVKHTEGGGVVALNITGDLPSEVGAEIQDHTTADKNSTPPPTEPLSDSDYLEIINVITKDATEADDVVLEIQDRIADMESTLERVLEQRDSLLTACLSTTEVFRRLVKFSSRKLPQYVSHSQKFSQTWKSEHERMQSGMAGLDDLRALYMGFLEAYDGLILEVARRKAAKLAVTEVLRDARARLDRLYEEDVRAREVFWVDQGDYLPSDIWPGLSIGPTRIEFRRVLDVKPNDSPSLHPEQNDHQDQMDTGQAENNNPAELIVGDTGDSIPNIPRHVTDQAFARLSLRNGRS
ncbi:autophagy protein 17 [Myotisia sp. PD_48]|nr:autophagy protein 17 [Myotisia sp. PD_48]